MLRSFSYVFTLYGPRQAKMCLQTCAKCRDSEYHAHAQSQIQAFALHSYIMKYPMIMLKDSEVPDQIARMRRLIWAFAVRICMKTHFHMTRSICLSIFLRRNKELTNLETFLIF